MPLTQSLSSRTSLVGDRICVAISADSPEALFEQSSALLPKYRFQELRLDTLADPRAVLQALRQHIVAHPEAEFLVTCRPVTSGGHWQADPQAEADMLTQAALAGARWVDLSLESAEALGPDGIAGLRATGVGLVLSWHDFTGFGDPQAVLARMRPFAPAIRKIVPTAHRLTENLALFSVLQGADGPLVGICMGEAGVASRVLGPRYGSAFTFAAPTRNLGTAPGQMDADTLRSQYRLESIGAATQVFGVAGSPIRSSLSPLMFNTAFGHTHLDAVDIPLLTDSAEELFEFAAAVSLAGCSVTMPLKQAVLPFLQHTDPLAERIGAVNTLRRRQDGSYEGFNTDAAGVTEPLKRLLDLRGARVLVLGAGGAARAAVFGCLAEGAQVFITNRTFSKAEALAAQSGARALPFPELRSEPLFDVLIQATPAGMNSSPDTPPEFEQVDARIVFDLVYNPLETSLLKVARARGSITIPGVEMFLHQGARQFELWTGHPAPLDVMRDVVLDALRSR